MENADGGDLQVQNKIFSQKCNSSEINRKMKDFNKNMSGKWLTKFYKD